MRVGKICVILYSSGKTVEDLMEDEKVKKFKAPKILWISRHRPLEAQIDYIAKKLDQFAIVIYDKPLATAEDAIKLVREFDAQYVVPVLPLSFIIRLIERAKKCGFTVLRAEMENIHNCKEVPCPDYVEYSDVIMESRDLTTGEKIHRHFRFKWFEVLEDVKIVSRRW